MLRYFKYTQRKVIFTISITWAIIASSSFVFERIHDDEVIYFLQARSISQGNIIAHGGLIFVPQLLGSLFAATFNSIIGVRILSSIAVLLTAILIYMTKRDKTSFASSMLYLFSFYTIRFGFRFYLDPFGGLFAVLGVYALYRAKGHLAGASSVLAALSRQLAMPLLPAFVYSAYNHRTGMRAFVLSLIASGILGLSWLFLASGAKGTVSAGTGTLESVSIFGINHLGFLPESWVEYLFLSPLVVVGLVFSRRMKNNPEFYPLVLSAVVLSFTPGFLFNGAATEYPYIFNTLACLPAGVGLYNIYSMLGLNMSKFSAVLVSVLVALFLAQSYLATVVSPNGVIGIQDYGYWNDMALISYLNQHYTGGKIYGSNLDGLLSQKLSSNWVWAPQSVAQALKQDPEWLVTFSSYVKINNVPDGASVEKIGQFVVIYAGNNSLSSFVAPTNTSTWRIW